MPKTTQGKNLTLVTSLLTVLACSQTKGISQWMRVPDNTHNDLVKGAKRQFSLEKASYKRFDFKQLPPYVFGTHIIPFMWGSEIHNLIRTARGLRHALWKEVPFLFKRRERKWKLRKYMANPEGLIPIATMSLKQYILANYPSSTNEGSIIFPSTPVKKINQIDLLAIKSDLFIHFLNRLGFIAMYTSNRRFAFKPYYPRPYANTTMYIATRFLTAIYDYLSLPNILKALHIPDDAQVRNDIQRAICAKFSALSALQNTNADHEQRQSAKQLLQAILAAEGDSWLSQFDFDEIAFYHSCDFLSYEAMNGYTRVSKQLIRFGANVDTKDCNGCAPIHFAAQHENLGVIKFLLEHHASIDQTDREGMTALSRAAWYGHSGTVNALLAEGASINSLDNSKRTPLHYACENNHLEVVRLLLTKGADINSTDHLERTPLHYACENNHLEVVRLLLTKGADVHRQDKYGKSMLHIAVRRNTLNLARLLIRHGANVGARNHHGATPLHFTVYAGFPQAIGMIFLLLDNGANINAQDNHGYTPLMNALLNSSRSRLAELLIDCGADVNISLPSGDGPLQQAEHHFIKAQKSIWYNIMGFPPDNNEKAKYLYFLAAMHGIKPPLESLPYPKALLPLIIGPQDTFLVLIQHPLTHIKQAFGDVVHCAIKEAYYRWQILSLIEQAAVAQKQLGAK